MTSIDGFSNYIIYEDGEVISLKIGFSLKPQIKKGYKELKLINDDGERKHLKLHRLLGLAFIPNPENKPCIDHIDENKSNNHLSNLRWATYAENQQNIKQPKKNNKLNEKYISIQVKNNYKYYRFTKVINGKKHCKTFKTLEEAKEYRDYYLKNI